MNLDDKLLCHRYYRATPTSPALPRHREQPFSLVPHTESFQCKPVSVRHDAPEHHRLVERFGRGGRGCGDPETKEAAFGPGSPASTHISQLGLTANEKGVQLRG
jgi:hypothetical protein